MGSSQKGVKGFVGEGDVSLGSEAWNVADGYTKIKILKQLIFLDRYENISLYGFDDIDEEDHQDPNLINTKRKDALSRYISTLKQLLGNVKFAIRKDDRPKISEFLDKINQVEEYVGAVSELRTNQITHEVFVLINEDHMKNCVDVLRTIKDEVNFPINNAGLIFKGSDEIDLDKIMNDIVDGG